ncbi:MAG TPA: cell division protein CrgA [Acidimicrobiales bacterium]|nr:cell division protein CrgA [Acidimicrobiales bacterium]
MAKRAPGRRQPSTGRTTPKGTGGRPSAARGTPRAGRQPAPSGRYTPPILKERKVSPRWVPVVLFGFLLSGAAVIVLNYLSLLPGEADNRYLLLGLALITGGFITATKYH